MKLINTYMLAFTLILGLVSCKDNTEPEVKTVEVNANDSEEMAYDPNATFTKAEFGIEGMTCAMGCAKTIEKKLAKMDGVKAAKVDFDKQIAMVEYNEDKVTPNSLEEAVAMAGKSYKVNNMKTVDEFTVEKLCTKACCKGLSDEERAKCKEDCCKGDKMACAEDCKKACCVEKA